MTKLATLQDEFVIRMYRTGHGDCFLLAFPNAQGTDTVHVMIDCGRKGGSWYPEHLHGIDIATIVEHLGEACDHKLDLAIATHEHDDHLNGITETNFEAIEIGETWLPWTQNLDGDETARKLHGLDVELVKELVNIRKNLTVSERVGAPILLEIDEMIERATGNSFEELDSAALFEKGSGGYSNRKAIDLLQSKAGKENVHFLEPGMKPLYVPGTNVRVFVLGPPRDAESIDSYLPTGAEAYEEETPKCASSGVAPICKERDQKSVTTFLEAELEFKKDNGDQRNNLSLVLAFELPKSKKVLFFAGDAQRGNWISWGKLRWRVDGKDVKAQELLGRSVLYKSGHHGALDANLNGVAGNDWPNINWMGLGPAADEFVVMITAVNRWACSKCAPWSHPLPSIKAELSQKAVGGLYQTDDGCPGETCQQIYFDHVVYDSWGKVETDSTPAPIQAPIAACDE
jgi:hypothetical protein